MNMTFILFRKKVESIVAFPIPTNWTELRRYLAMVGCYRGFCKNFSAVSPLTDLLRAPVLVAPRFDLPFK